MRQSLVLALILPLLVAAQNVTTILSTSFTTVDILGPSRVLITSTSPVVFTITSTIAGAASPAGNSTASGNSTITGSPQSSNATSTSSTTPTTLPTAPTSGVYGGGGLSGQAPVPGQTGVGGIYGPDDGYIAGATSLNLNAAFVTLVGLVMGVGLLL